MLGRKYMLKKLLAEPPKHDTRFLPYLMDGWHRDREEYMDTETYLEYSMQACPFDTVNPAWFVRDPRTTFKHRGASSK